MFNIVELSDENDSSVGGLDGIIDGKFDLTKGLIEGELDSFEDGIDDNLLVNKLGVNVG